MKCYLSLFLTCMLYFSCTKNADLIHTSLDGSWKMIAAKNNFTNITSIRPPNLIGDVIITFTSSNVAQGSVSGQTPSNLFGPNDYTTGPGNKINLPVKAITKVAETKWGELFADNIRLAQKYSFEAGGLMNITTTFATLTFKKI